ncbi:uncharacterized protein L201_003857 [Kwoniella dendrophila CBS 6074]|uniref:Dienelactone hydrolase domain-containing protein n=1 Tax=Kwoniella dendrophila CBS 6074 TaxID=1295534 RepID=A0AAX4JUB2_9TREE
MAHSGQLTSHPFQSQPSKFPSDVEHAPRVATSSHSGCKTEKLQIKVNDGHDGSFTAFFHRPDDSSGNSISTVGVILLSGAGGGVTGPSGIYLSIADKLASLPDGQAIPTLRMDYRYPARNKYCVSDVFAPMDWLQIESKLDINRFVLVGWSFGGAPAFTVGGKDKRVIGVATVASQTAETEGIKEFAPAPVLLLHGTGDRTLSPRCSERLYEMYGSTKGQRTLHLFPDDDHALTRNSKNAEEMICEFIVKCAGIALDTKVKNNIEADLGPDTVEEKIGIMKKGGDLGGLEHVE